MIYTAYFAYSTKLDRAGRRGARQDRGRGEVRRAVRADQGRVQQGLRRRRRPHQGRHAGRATCWPWPSTCSTARSAKQAAKYLVEDIEKRDCHLSTGFIGTKDLMLVLAKIGRNDVAYRLLHNDTFPSWGFSIKHGATSIWERWDGWTPEKGFQDPGMNSFAHYSLRRGLPVDGREHRRHPQPSARPTSTSSSRPTPGGKLTWAKTSYDSVHGRIVSDWQRDGQKLTLEVTIPANTTATVFVPENPLRSRARSSSLRNNTPMNRSRSLLLAAAAAHAASFEEEFAIRPTRPSRTRGGIG